MSATYNFDADSGDEVRAGLRHAARWRPADQRIACRCRRAGVPTVWPICSRSESRSTVSSSTRSWDASRLGWISRTAGALAPGPSAATNGPRQITASSMPDFASRVRDSAGPHCPDTADAGPAGPQRQRRQARLRHDRQHRRATLWAGGPLTVRANGVVVSEITSPALEVGQSTLECDMRTKLGFVHLEPALRRRTPGYR